jgi:hypothetical protein
MSFDARAIEAARLARQEIGTVALPDPAAMIERRRAQRRARRAAIAAAAVVVLGGATAGVLAARPGKGRRPAVTVAPERERARLEFRQVIRRAPYWEGNNGEPCHPLGRGATIHTIALPEEVLTGDRNKTVCVTLGPVLLDGTHVTGATAQPIPGSGGWEVVVHYDNDDFTEKVGVPMVGEEIAARVDGVVYAIQPIAMPIETRDVVMGPLAEADARELAERLSP